MASEEQVKVLGFWASPYAIWTLIALEEKSVKYVYQEENLANKSQLLLEMNPVHKKIPVLIHNGRPVVESLIILQYIDEAWPSSDGNFLPPEPYDRAMARFWANFIQKKLYDSENRMIGRKGEGLEEAKRDLAENLGILEGALEQVSGGKPYFGGEAFGYVDIVLAPFVCWIHVYESIANFKVPLKEKYPNISAWMKRCTGRESVKKILPQPEKVLEFAAEIRSRSAIE